MQRAALADSTRHPEKSSGNAHGISALPSRRGVLGGLAIIPTVAAIAAPAIAGEPRRSRWHDLRARYEEAKRVHDHYEDHDYARALDRMWTTLGPIPAMDYDIPCKNGQVLNVKVTAKGTFPPLPQYDRAREMQRYYNAWYARCTRINAEPWYAEPAAKMDRLQDALDRAREELMDEPAPDGHALAYKVRLAFENEEIWANEREAIERDAKRLTQRI